MLFWIQNFPPGADIVPGDWRNHRLNMGIRHDVDVLLEIHLPEKKLKVEDLQLGMYVAKLDRPWLETPFLLEGLLLKDWEDVEAIRKFSQYVYIDIEKGKDFTGVTRRATRSTKTKPKPNQANRRQTTKVSGASPIDAELPHATELRHQANNLLDTIRDNIRAGRAIDAEGAKTVIKGMVDSVIRNPGALLWLAQIKDTDEYTATHSINVSILAIAFGQHLGLSPEILHELGLGALLHDLGKIKMPPEILKKPGRLTKEEFEVMKQHPKYGVEILRHAKGLSDAVIDVAHSHHERANGEGYPQGLMREQISQFARITQIVDFYDAVTSNRVYRPGKSSADVTHVLYENQGNIFDTELTEKFIRFLGVFPIGSLVELDTREVGIVLSVDPARSLKPTLLMVLDKNKHKYNPLRITNLWQLDIHNITLEIKRILKPGAHGIQVGDYTNTVGHG